MNLKFWEKKKDSFKEKAEFLIYFHNYLDKGNLLPYELSVAKSLSEFYFNHWVLAEDGVTMDRKEINTFIDMVDLSNADLPTAYEIVLNLRDKYFPLSDKVH